jgi:DNA-binding transcriptional MocR family regulator
MTDKFYGEMKYRARRESIARQLTGLDKRPQIRMLSIHFACSAEKTTEVVALVEISGRVQAIAVCAAESNGRHRVNAIEIVRPTS